MSGGHPPEPRLEPTSRWIRVRVGETVIADSRHAQLLVRYPPNGLPTYVLPASDVRTDLLTDEGDLQLDGTSLKAVADRVGAGWTFVWDGRIRWFEEATEIFGHPRDPQHRVDALQSERHVVIKAAGELIAESSRPVAVFETSLPTRWYLPADDVRLDLLANSEKVTRCPYKGVARYWSIRVGDELLPDLVWSYADPLPDGPRIKDLIAFYDEQLDVTIDGELQSRPATEL